MALLQIHLPDAWERVAPASGVRVAVIDTGVLSGHPDIAEQLVDGYDFIASRGISVDGDGCDPDPEDPGDGLTPGSSSYHGTHVAGTLAAAISGIDFTTQLLFPRPLAEPRGAASGPSGSAR